MKQLASESGASQVPLDPKEKRLMLERQQLAEAEKREKILKQELQKVQSEVAA